VLEHHNWVGPGRIRDGYSFFGSFFGDKVLVMCQLAVPYQRRRLYIPLAHFAVTLHHNKSVAGDIFDGYRLAG